MTPETKAKEIVDKYMGEVKNYFNYGTHEYELSKSLAIIHVNGIIDSWSGFTGMYDQEIYDGQKKFWQQVLNEIQSL